MQQFSDSDTTDSDDGIRFKTDSTRNKNKSPDRSNWRRGRGGGDDSRELRRRGRSESPARKHRRSASGGANGAGIRVDDRQHRGTRHKDRDRRENHDHSNSSSSSKRSKSSRERERDREQPSSKHQSTSAGSGGSSNCRRSLSRDGAANKDCGHGHGGKTTTGERLLIQKAISDLTNDRICENVVYGPALPPKPAVDDNLSNTPITDAAVRAPTLALSTSANSRTSDIPDNDGTSSNTVIMGPFIPSHLRQQMSDRAADQDGILRDDSASDEDAFGPLPAGAALTSAHVALEERALQHKMDQLSQHDDEAKQQREDWMTVLPDVGGYVGLGLGPRQFRANAGPDFSDRSSWTDTPQDKQHKRDKRKPVDVRAESELVDVQRRDEEQDDLVKRHRDKSKKKKRDKDRDRDKSLLEIHQERLKKKTEEKPSGVRRPFNRDVDLKVNQFDEAQKKAIYKKAQNLNDRFSKGESKYL